MIWLCCFFFFKQKTAYEMRISDWSSDVCSSDLRISKYCLLIVMSRHEIHSHRVAVANGAGCAQGPVVRIGLFLNSRIQKGRVENVLHLTLGKRTARFNSLLFCTHVLAFLRDFADAGIDRCCPAGPTFQDRTSGVVGTSVSVRVKLGG